MERSCRLRAFEAPEVVKGTVSYKTIAIGQRLVPFCRMDDEIDVRALAITIVRDAEKLVADQERLVASLKNSGHGNEVFEADEVLGIYRDMLSMSRHYQRVERQLAMLETEFDRRPILH